MCRQELENIVRDVHNKFHVELAICEVFKRRWSYITGTKNYVSGRYRIGIDEKYGIIVNCEKQDVDRIKMYIKKG
ncbi:hypothetical protein [Vallitalea sp.]|jgi:hypothetical protein|uniref:hypothetical protein n=1 Tax=Vallitalea sp. TaxID=1882829 RepID=UPI0025FEDCEF|nr:hypothetical protein [Vallitalea sp.]MCT4687024.1 hypothetical protein [Vallitalea sp.]